MLFSFQKKQVKISLDYHYFTIKATDIQKGEPMNFGEKLYRLRIERGIYQKQLAAYLHVSVGTISNYENGVHSPDLKTLCKLANYFHVSADYMLDRTEYVSPIEDLNCQLIDQYTAGSIMNAIIDLSPDSRQDLMKYLALLAVCDDEELPPLSSLRRRSSDFIPPNPEPGEDEAGEENSPEQN